MAATLIVTSSASLADSGDLTSFIRHAYRMEEYNDAQRRQWQHDVQQWGLEADLIRQRAFGHGAERHRVNIDPLFFKRQARYAYGRLAQMAAAGAPRDPPGQKQILAFYMAVIDDYNTDSSTAKYFVPSARMAFLQAAYRIFNGDRFSDATARQFGMQALIWVMTNSPEFVGKSDLEKQALYERYIVLAGSFSLAYRLAGTAPGSKLPAQLRHLAAEALLKDMGRDPSVMSLDQLPCVVFPIPMFSCRAQLKGMRGGSL